MTVVQRGGRKVGGSDVVGSKVGAPPTGAAS